jgi:predicted amidohydrolase YtcJ
LRKNNLFYNGRIYTLAGDNVIVDSMAVSGRTIVAVGNNLDKDEDFKRWQKIDLKGRTVIPGFVDSHTHFYFLALWLGTAQLDGLTSMETVLKTVKNHAAKLGRNEWVTGTGFSADRLKKYILPDRYMLDKVCGGRPAAIYSKDQHMMWVNSKALELAGINRHTPQPPGGKIDLLDNGEPSGILRENPAIFKVLTIIKGVEKSRINKLWQQALKLAYSKGVTGIHSFDYGDALPFFDRLSQNGKLGLRISFYPPASTIAKLKKLGVKYGYGNEYFRVAGVKIFADGSLGSQTAYNFQKYIGSKNNYGIETKTKDEILGQIKTASKLNLPAAVHAIGDRAISNVLDCFEQAPELKNEAKHRIEHLQMIRRKDIARLKKLGVVASMQPSHCPSDIKLIEKYLGPRGRNCFVFNTLLKKKIPLTFGSDTPIEPLDPIMGIYAAVNRKSPGLGKTFYPEEKISILDAVRGFTSSPAHVVGRQYERGYLLPGYRADFVILSENIFKAAASKIDKIKVSATFFDGRPVYKDKASRLKF